MKKLLAFLLALLLAASLWACGSSHTEDASDGVELTLQEDASLVGGFILSVGDSVLDKSLRTAILKMQRHFAVR